VRCRRSPPAIISRNVWLSIRLRPKRRRLLLASGKADSTDNAAKLSDPNPPTPAERDALVKGHSKALECRQIIISHDNVFAAWELPHWRAYFARQDELFTKLASGELPVGVANKLNIESTDQFQTEAARGQADETRLQQVQGERRTEAAMQASAAMAANQPRMTSQHCTWMGNSINCTGTQ
jgi:hypothetical protein